MAHSHFCGRLVLNRINDKTKLMNKIYTFRVSTLKCTQRDSRAPKSVHVQRNNLKHNIIYVHIDLTIARGIES